MKVKVISAVLAMLAFSCNASAEETYLFTEYGAASYTADFEGVSDSGLTSYPYFFSGTGETTIGDGIFGERGLHLDMSKTEEGALKYLLFSFHSQAVTAKPEKESYYFEIYLKGCDEIPNNISPYYTYDAKAKPGSFAAIGDSGAEMCKNGTVKLWFTVPVLSDYSINGHAGWIIEKTADMPNEVVFDNFAMRPIPEELAVENRTVDNSESFDLSLLAVSGVSALGSVHSIVNKQLINWEILEGEAEVSDGKLIFTSSVPQKIRLAADFFGVKAESVLDVGSYLGEYDIDENGGVTASITKNADGYSAEITNTGSEQTVYFLTAVYVDGKMYDVCAKTVHLEENEKITVQAASPKMTDNRAGEIKTRSYIWSGNGGMGHCAKFE